MQKLKKIIRKPKVHITFKSSHTQSLLKVEFTFYNLSILVGMIISTINKRLNKIKYRLITVHWAHKLF